MKTKPTIQLACDGCGETFSREAGKVRRQMAWGYKKFYCDLNCQRSRRKLPWQQEIIGMEELDVNE